MYAGRFQVAAIAILVPALLSADAGARCVEGAPDVLAVEAISVGGHSVGAELTYTLKNVASKGIRSVDGEVEIDARTDYSIHLPLPADLRIPHLGQHIVHDQILDPRDAAAAIGADASSLSGRACVRHVEFDDGTAASYDRRP